MVNEMEIPIDIHCNKLLDWLLSRRHCNKDWQKSVMIIREKISEAIQDMPEDERIVKLLQGNPKMYEKKNIHLAEAAQILQRMIQYEIPALKKQISKSDQTITDCMKKENDYTKQIIDSRKQYEKELLKLGIEVYEWKNNVKPARIELPSLDAWANEMTENNADDEIDFGDDMIIPDNKIDFGDSKFQIEVVEDEKVYNINDGIARDLDALTLLENPQTRILIYFELKEVNYFRKISGGAKKDETLESKSDIYILGMEERPAALRKITVEKIDKWLVHVNEIINKLTDSQKVHLFQMRSSPQYVKKLVEILEQKRSLEEHYKKMKAMMIDKQSEMRISIQKARETLNGICETSKVLQKEIEEEISKIYKGRKVNIMGGINAAMMT
ncbi:CDK5 regulatory subunit-associated protein [Dirofilaria immitis]|nr:CDK5 regulatory subunit-associated protein [Dirofilaria immitis]